jgi:transposase
MYLKRTHNKKTGRTYLSAVHNYHDKEKGYSRTRTVESFGYLDELEKEFNDPISHFQKVVDEKNLALKLENAEYTISAKKNQTLEKNAINRKNYGYIIIMKIFYELGLDRFLLNRQQRDTKIECNTSTIMKLLIISRILSPGSKKKAFNEREKYFDFERKDAFNLTDIYRSLTHYASLQKDIQFLINDRITKKYGRDMDLIYYDVTNYYFEIDKEDELRKKGMSKENKKSPIVQLGLCMDAEGIPISYDLFPGNESEKLHLRPAILALKDQFSCGKVIAVADSAQNTGNNIYYLDQGKQGYVFSQSIRSASNDFKKYVADEKDYIWYGDEYKRKSKIVRREIKVDFTRPDGTIYKKSILVDQRQIVFYSEKYAIRSKTKREEAVKKAHKIIKNPSAYTKATSYGALKYVKNVEVDKETGEIKETKATPDFDFEKLREDEKYDGYYAIVTNVFNDGKNKGLFDDEKIIEIYRGLWRIEDSFRVTKSDLSTRPVYVSRSERIEAHFLTCFISLVIIRLIQKRTGNKYSAKKLIETLNNISCSHESENLFLFDFRDDVSDELSAAFGIDFTMKRLTRGEIKKSLGDVKKA